MGKSTSFVDWHVNKKRHNHGVKQTANNNAVFDDHCSEER